MAENSPSGHDVSTSLEVRQQARASVRELVTSGSEQGRADRKWIAPAAAIAAVAAAACAPVVWPLLLTAGAGGGAVVAVTAALTQVGGVSTGLLAEAIIRSWDRVRSHNRPDAGQEALRDALSAELQVSLAENTPGGAALRYEVAAVLKGVEAVSVALAATIEETGASVRQALVRGLRTLGEEFAEFGWVLDEVNQQLTVIAEDVALNAAATREVAEKQQQALMQLAMLRQEARQAYDRRPDQVTPAITADPSVHSVQNASPDAAAAPPDANCPYLGLSAFQPADVERFFGREQLTAELVARAAEQLARPGILMVLGPSGSGKSSLLRAGLMPAISSGILPARGSWAWPADLMTPGRHPLLELAIPIASLARIPASAVEAELRTDPTRITGVLRQALITNARRWPEAQQAYPEPRLVLIVDQFEEIFTQCSDEHERQMFISALCAAAGAISTDDPDDPLGSGQIDAREAPALVIIGVRADFYARISAYPELAPQLQQNQVLVGPMDEAGLRAAIEKPATAANLVVDADLVEVLLADVGNYQTNAHATQVIAANDGDTSAVIMPWDSYPAGRLALLSYALQQTWHNRTGRRLTLAGYKATGRIDGAISQAADSLYNRLSPAGQAAVQRVLLRLVTLREGIPDTLQRVPLAELIGPEKTQQAEITQAVLADLIDARLVTAGADTIEITHETLLTAWPRLQRWLTDDRIGLRTHRDLTDAAREWEREGREPSRLFRGARLATIREWAEQHGEDLNANEEAFLAASQRDQLSAIRWRRRAIAALVVVTLIALTAAGFAFQSAANANRQHAIALSRQLAAESLSIDSSDPMTAGQLAVAAWRESGTDQARSAMTSLLAEQQEQGMLLALPSVVGGVSGVAFSPDGGLLASADGDGNVRVWNPANGQPIRTLHATNSSYGVNGVAFSPNGKLLASADSDGNARVWDVANGQPIRTLHVTNGFNGVNGVAFSPDGKLLASADSDGTARVWDVANGQPIRTLHASDGYVNGVAFSPDGKLLASADSDGTARVWDVATGQPARTLHATNSNNGINGVNGVAFSLDGKLLASADGDGNVRLWNPDTGQPIRTLHATNSSYGVNGVAFSPDGKLLASADDDGNVRLWNPTTGNAAGPSMHIPATPTLAIMNGSIDGVAFSSNSALLAIADGDGTVRLWDTATSQPVGSAFIAGPLDLLNGVSGVAFSPDGKLLASADSDGNVRVWDVATGQPAPTLHATNSDNGVNGVAFSPNGKLLASADSDGNVRLWNPDTGQPARTLHATNSDNGVNGVAFSPNGKLLASADGDGNVRVWDVSTGQPIRTLHATNSDNGVNGVAFSPNGKLLASADGDGNVRVWDVSTGQPASTLHATNSDNGVTGVNGVAFSPDGKLLASADDDGNVRLWNPDTGRPVGVSISDTGSILLSVNGVAFSPNGKLLAAAGSDGIVHFWNASASSNPYAALCAEVGPPTQEAWQQYAAGEPQPKICP